MNGTQNNTNTKGKAMTTYRNANYTTRNYECTNVVACQSESHPGENWVECDESVLVGLTQLEIVGGVRYFGHL